MGSAQIPQPALSACHVHLARMGLTNDQCQETRGFYGIRFTQLFDFQLQVLR
jgi:hypothetical protein